MLYGMERKMQAKLILIGNALFIVCCVFYLMWWLLAFRPSGAISGMKTGWLLIPAFLSGLAGVITALWGILGKMPGNRLFSGWHILWGGIVLYFLLLAVTVLLFKRQLTSELFLITGWGMLAVAEINALFGLGLFSHGFSMGFIMVICAAVIISLVCYVLYYRLDSKVGYIDGMVPLVLAAGIMAGITVLMTKNLT